jgi:Tol biopolymer transport system component
MTSDGRNLERLTNTADENVVMAAISVDGHQVLFRTSGTRLDSEIYLLDMSSKRTSQLTDAPAYDLIGDFSPDGKRVAFVSDRDGGYYHLYLMNSDGSEQQHISLDTDTERDVTNVGWSPDGSYILYGTRQHVYAQGVLTPSLYLLNLSTLSATRLTDERLGNCINGQWSPDGKRILTACNQNASLFDQSQVYLIHTAGTTTTQLTNAKQHGTCFDPSWSRSGEWITMVCAKGGDYGEVYVIRPDGSELRKVTTRPANDQPIYNGVGLKTWIRHPLWSPDGRQIIYNGLTDGHWRIYITEGDGTNNRRLTAEGTTNWLEGVYQLP